MTIVDYVSDTQVMIVMEENSESLMQFLVSLCGIIGGVITVMR